MTAPGMMVTSRAARMSTDHCTVMAAVALSRKSGAVMLTTELAGKKRPELAPTTTPSCTVTSAPADHGPTAGMMRRVAPPCTNTASGRSTMYPGAHRLALAAVDTLRDSRNGVLLNTALKA